MIHCPKILIDWGGTLVRDAELFEEIARKSGNSKISFDSPDRWDNIKFVGTENYFEKIEHRFFSMGRTYVYAEDALKELYEKYQIHIVYDNRPQFESSVNRTQLLLAKTLTERRIEISGIFVDPDKLSICKNLKIDVAVEDDPRIAMSLASAGIRTILISRLWNRSFSLDSQYIPSKKKEAIQKNLIITEDWFETSQWIKQNIHKEKNND